jgi:hypothetical protein
MTDQWDAFLSYASEDREEVAEPLYRLLEGFGLRIWFDRTELKVGDSLRERIDEGLARCRFGIVVLSSSFFAKHYPQRELNGLAQREIDGEKVILPVWHRIDAAQVRAYSPPLADRIAATSEEGLNVVAAKLILALQPDLPKEIQAAAKKLRDLPELRTGRQLFDLMASVHMHYLFDDPIADESDVELVGGFRTMLSEIADFAEDVDHTEQLRWQLNLTEQLAELNAAGWRVFGERRRRKVKLDAESISVDVALVALLKRARKAAAYGSNKIMVARDDDQSSSQK